MAELAALATAADLANSLPDDQPLPDGDLDYALAVASFMVRAAAGAVISSTTSTITIPAPWGQWLSLPSPVTGVASVSVDGTAVTGYRMQVDGLFLDEGWADAPGAQATIVFTHGLAVVPKDVVDLTCQLALEWLAYSNEGGGATVGLQSVKLDDAAETYTLEHAARLYPVYVPTRTAEDLKRRFSRGGATVVRLGQ